MTLASVSASGVDHFFAPSSVDSHRIPYCAPLNALTPEIRLLAALRSTCNDLALIFQSRLEASDVFTAKFAKSGFGMKL